ncbi:UNVERIFIED_CONTAM: hypothetical protein FKN15_078352 [Acipenser sinensis]
MAVNEGDEVVLSMVDVLEENEELENEASAVLGGSDPEKCSYPKGYVKRQALYACSTCTPKDEDPAGICLACSYKCHEGHNLYELYTKRNFRCDCGNSKFKGFECRLYSGKDTLNTNNKYNQNFVGLYCTCKRPYPDPEDEHLGAISTESVELQEMICVSCTNRTPFLWAYAAQLAVSPIETDVDMSMEEAEGKKGVKEETENKASEPSAEETPTCKSEGQQPSTSTASDQKILCKFLPFDPPAAPFPEYNDLKTELKDYLKRFADEGKVVTSEDIQDFFEQLRSRKRRRVDNDHHYST